MIITIEGESFAVGLEWSSNVVRGPHVQVEVKLKDTIYGLAEKSDEDMPSLAAICMDSYDEGIFVAEGDKGEYWSCIILGGVIAPGSDRLFDGLDTLIEYIETDGSVTDSHIALGHELPSISFVDVFKINDIDFEPFKIRKDSKGRAQYKKLGIFVLVVGLSLGGWTGYQKYNEKQEADNLASQIEAQRLQHEQQMTTNMSIIASHGLRAANSAMASLMTLPVVVPGWTVDSYRVFIEGGEVVVGLTNMRGTTKEADDFLSKFIKNTSSSFVGDRSSLEVHGAIPINLTPEKNVFMGEDNLISRVNDLSNVMGVAISFDAAPTFDVPSVWHVEVKSLEKTRLLMRGLTAVHGITIDSIRMEDGSYFLRGKGYVK